MKRLNVGVICYPTVGGSGVVATELGKKMASRGHTMHFIASEQPFRLTELTEQLQFHPVKIEDYAVFQYPPYDIALANKISQVIVQEKLDLLHVHYAMPHAIAAALGRDMAKSDIPIITTLHGTDVTILGAKESLKDTVRYGIERSTITTAVSDGLKEETYELIQPDASIETIYNFIDESIYYVNRKRRPNIRKEFNISPEQPVYIHISNFREVKRIDYIVDSFARILKQKNAHLLLVGDGPERKAMERYVEKLQITSSVTFTGKRQDTNDLLNASDVMLHLSDKEAFGLVILEAFACGLPVVATNIGGIPEVVMDGKNGYLVELDEPERVAQYALQLLEPTQYEQFSQEALDTARTKFNCEHIVDQYEALYEKVTKHV